MANASTTAWLDQQDSDVAETIRKHGEGGEPPPSVYSVGLFGLGHAELLIFGAPPVTVAGVVNNLYLRVSATAFRRRCNRGPAPSVSER